MTDNQRRIRVMRIIARLNIGGPAIHVALLTERLPADTYETMLVVGSLSDDEGDMTYYATERNVEPVIVPNLRREISLIQDLRVLQSIRKLIKEYQPDVVHTHTAKAGFIGRLAAKLEGVPVVVHTFHGHVFRGYFGALKSQIFINMERMAANWADTIITLTNSLRRELAEEYGITRKGHITVLPLGLDLHPFVIAKRKSGEFCRQWDIPAHCAAHRAYRAAGTCKEPAPVPGCGQTGAGAETRRPCRHCGRRRRLCHAAPVCEDTWHCR